MTKVERPSKEDVEQMIKTFNDIALFVAIRNLWNKPEPSVIKTFEWLKQEFGIATGAKDE
jgi:hypothetical protein